MTDALLSVRDLSVAFDSPEGEIRAVDGVSFDLRPGETLGLVGESGCGKTVTALSLLRLIPTPPGRIAPSSVIEFQGTNLLTLAPEALRQVRGAEIAMVFQEPAASLNPVLTIGLQITETLHAHRAISRRDARARAAELLDLVGIPDAHRRLDDYPHQLSGGIQQRVMIAIALSCEPKIVVADEPTTALDVTVQAQVLDLLADLRSRLGMAMLLITHDLDVLAGLADRIAVMYAGQLVESASAANVFASPAHPYTEALLAAAPRLDRPVERLPAIPGAVPQAARWPAGCRFHPRCRYAWDRCTHAAPSLQEVAPQRHNRCWLVDEPERRPS